RLFAGDDDPCIINRSAFVKTVHLFSDNGYTNVAYITYPGQRHALLNDTKAANVLNDMLNEMDSICLEKGAVNPARKSTHIVLDDFIDPEVNKPLVKEEKLNLEDFINRHTSEADKAADRGSRVEMIDYKDIRDVEFDPEEFISPLTGPALKADLEVSEPESDTDTDISSEPKPETETDTETAAGNNDPEHSSDNDKDVPGKISKITDPDLAEVIEKEAARGIDPAISHQIPSHTRTLEFFSGFSIDPDNMEGM
ncbi:MAG: hypothetical protein HUJ76_06860, partial [Parasporobacterium sp.]|nr:hypothetical protein [Parasporobacterium sp.]